MATLDQIASELADPDARTTPRDERILKRLQDAAPRALAEAAAQAEAAEVKAAVLERADAAWRDSMDEQAFALLLEYDMHPDFD